MNKRKSLLLAGRGGLPLLAMTLGALAGVSQGSASGATVFSENFESYTGAATALEDTATANPDGPQVLVQDDDPAGASGAGTGVQLVNWLASEGDQALLVRNGSEAQVHIQAPQSGASYQLDFDLHSVKGEGDRGFYMIVRAMGSDTNGEDFLAYRSDRAAGNALFYYAGIDPNVGWVPVGVEHAEGAWQHHRFVFNMREMTFDLYVDDMENAVVVGGPLSRSSAAVPTMIILRHEGNSEDDGYFAIDDLALTVEESVTLASVFTEGFEDYTAAPAFTLEDADPQGPWVTTEAVGSGTAALSHEKVQVVGTDMVTPRSGEKALKIEGGQRAGVTYAWGTMPEQDVRVTWWARVPASVPGTQATYLRMSLYGAEGGRTLEGDSALLGYGSRDGNVGDETSLTVYTTGWVDTLVDYVPDTWEEYQLTTHVEQGSYTIVKNPSSENPEIIVDRAPFIGSAASWGPHWMVGFSSSNGSGHPPVYLDDVRIESLTTSVEPLPDPYDVNLEGSRFGYVTTLNVGGQVGDAAVDPRDNSTIFFTTDVANGGIYRAVKVSAGNWAVDEEPIVSGLDRPSGLVVDGEGTLWWTHDYGMRLMRLKAPYEGNDPEIIISNFGPLDTDDDPIDLAIAPESMVNYPGYVIVADRGADGDADNALYFVDPATTELDQVGYQNYLVTPSATLLGSINLNAAAPVPGSGEVAVLNADALIYLADGNGFTRSILPNIYADPFVDIGPASIAVDPTTDRIWLADDLFDEIWSLGSGFTPEEETLELSFTLREGSRPDSNIDFHDPGMEFAANGSLLVVTDGSTSNGGGRLHIFHNEEPVEPPTDVSITGTSLTEEGFVLQWDGAAGLNYRVERAAEVDGTFEDVSGVITETEFTDANPPGDAAFYRVVTLPE